MSEGVAENSAISTASGAYPSITLKIWPPSQRSRDAVIENLVAKLTADPFLSRYGLLSPEDAKETALRVEKDAFDVAASDAAAAAVDDDGMEALQVYSREISKRILESVKNRAGNAAAAPVEEP